MLKAVCQNTLLFRSQLGDHGRVQNPGPESDSLSQDGCCFDRWIGNIGRARASVPPSRLRKGRTGGADRHDLLTVDSTTSLADR